MHHIKGEFIGGSAGDQFLQVGDRLDAYAVNGQQFVADLGQFSKWRTGVIGGDGHLPCRFFETDTQPSFPFLVGGVWYQF